MNKKIFSRTEIYLVLLIMVFSIGATSVSRSFLTFENIFSLIRSSSGMAVLAIGFFIVLLSGGIDISFCAMAITAQYITINIMLINNIDNVFLAFLIACSIGILLGSINCIFISLFKFPTLIVTLGTLNIFHGGLLAFVGTKSINVDKVPPSVIDFGIKSIFTITDQNGSSVGLSVFILIVIGVAVLSWIILRYTMLGRGIYAIGGNREASIRAGFNIVGIQFFVYCYMGFLSGIMGIMYTALNRSSTPTNIIGDELIVIAAVVLGGAKITGGRGSIIGTILGVIMLSILQKNLIILGLPSYWVQIFIGFIIIISVTSTSYQAKRRSIKELTFG